MIKQLADGLAIFSEYVLDDGCLDILGHDLFISCCVTREEHEILLELGWTYDYKLSVWNFDLQH